MVTFSEAMPQACYDPSSRTNPEKQHVKMLNIFYARFGYRYIMVRHFVPLTTIQFNKSKEVTEALIVSLLVPSLPQGTEG